MILAILKQSGKRLRMKDWFIKWFICSAKCKWCDWSTLWGILFFKVALIDGFNFLSKFRVLSNVVGVNWNSLSIDFCWLVILKNVCWLVCIVWVICLFLCGLSIIDVG